jgi:hypothetical protein
MLFQTWLAETRKLQIESFGTDPAALEGDELLAYLFVQTFAATDEMHEASQEFSWKTWSSKKFLNRKEFIKENVDALHFIANALVAVKCTDEELTEIYEAKMEVNRQRMANNYQSDYKCTECKRALDDVDESAIKGLCILCIE